MTRDYGTRRSTGRKSGTPHVLLVVAVSFLSGYLVSSFFSIDILSHWLNTQVLAYHEEKQVSHKVAPHEARLPPKPKFEFYTLLANEKRATPTQPNVSANHTEAPAGIPTTEAAQAASHIAPVEAAKAGSVQSAPKPPAVKLAEKKPLLPPQANEKGSWLVQVASFKARKDADQMKALLTLKGYTVIVSPVTQANKNWFRVVVGPYSDRFSAQKVQVVLLKAEHLNGMIKKI